MVSPPGPATAPTPAFRILPEHGRIAGVETSHDPPLVAPAPALDGGLELPYLVYGTLRPGGSNAHLVARHGGRHGAALVLDGYAMYDAPAGYPYLVPREGAGPVACDVVEPPGGTAARRALRADLDALEGFEVGGSLNHYERVAITFSDPDAARERWGWLYVAGPGALIDGLGAIESGDWFAR